RPFPDLLPGDIRDDQQDGVEGEGVAHVDRRHQVPDVRRIEGPPEHAQSHEAAGYRPCIRGKCAHIGVPMGVSCDTYPRGWKGNDNRVIRVEESAMSDAVGLYLNEIGQVSLLNAEEERELSRAIEAGRAASERIAAGDNDPELDEI